MTMFKVTTKDNRIFIVGARDDEIAKWYVHVELKRENIEHRMCDMTTEHIPIHIIEVKEK